MDLVGKIDFEYSLGSLWLTEKPFHMVGEFGLILIGPMVSWVLTLMQLFLACGMSLMLCVFPFDESCISDFMISLLGHH